MCSKPRVVYSPSQLSSSAIQFVEGVTKDYLYSCGSKLPSVCETEDLPVVREGINCNSLVEFVYYSSKKFKFVCALCGSDNDCTIDDDLKKEFQTVLCAEYVCLPTSNLSLVESFEANEKHLKDVLMRENIRRTELITCSYLYDLFAPSIPSIFCPFIHFSPLSYTLCPFIQYFFCSSMHPCSFVLILALVRQRIDQKRKKVWWSGRRSRKGAERG